MRFWRDRQPGIATEQLNLPLRDCRVDAAIFSANSLSAIIPGGDGLAVQPGTIPANCLEGMGEGMP